MKLLPRRAQKAHQETNVNRLVPKHIIKDDIMATINYMNCLAHGLGTVDDNRPPGQPPHPPGRRTLTEPVPHRPHPDGTGRPGEDDDDAAGFRGHHPPEPGQPSARSARAIKEFFGSPRPFPSSWTRTTPLAELTHKRRLSALGPGGLSRDRALLRGPRRPLHPLRPDVPDRDP